MDKEFGRGIEKGYFYHDPADVQVGVSATDGGKMSQKTVNREPVECDVGVGRHPADLEIH